MSKNKHYKSTSVKNKQKMKKKTPSFLSRIPSIKASPRIVVMLGYSLLFLAFFILLSQFSYFFTWQEDQDKLSIDAWELYANPDLEVDNWVGKIGAILSHTLIYKGFGILSLSIPFILFLISFRFIIKQHLLPLYKSFTIAVFFTIWGAILMGFLFTKFPTLGGEFGFYMNKWISSLTGKIGTGLLLLLSAVIFGFYHKIIPLQIAAFSKKETIETDEIKDLEDESNYTKETSYTTQKIELSPNKKDIDSSQTIDIIPSKETLVKTEIIENTLETNKEIVLENTPNASPPTQDPKMDLEIEEKELTEETLTDKAVNKVQKEFGDYDPTLDLSSYQRPKIELLKVHGSDQIQINKEELNENKNTILQTLENYKIKITSIKATIGPTVTLYEIVPAPGIRISKIKNLEDDIALSLSALGIRIIAPIPGKGTIGIEVPNQNPSIVSMRSVISSDKFQHAKMELPVVMGKTIANETFVFDLAKMPHLLMAGATGQGKSVGLNAVLTSLLYKKHPSQLKFVLVDPKKVELTLYNKIERHFLAKLPESEEAIITENQTVVKTLSSLCVEMDQRYELLKKAMVRNIVEYNNKFISRKLNPENGHKFLPYIVLVIDEFADLIMTAGKEVELPIARLAQLARAIGIHLIIATQRPSANIITGTIKANFPGRIAFRVTSGIDSRTILDSGGAEQLIGRGDMLISQGSDLTRLQCAFVDTPEVEDICEFIGDQRGYPDIFNLPESVDDTETGNGSVDKNDLDSLFEDAAHLIVQHQQGSASLLQRKMKIGYNRAGRIIDQLESAGIIGPFEGSKARKVLINDAMHLEQFLQDSSIKT